MLWLDSTFPVDKAGSPGAARGSCPTTSGVPAEIEASAPNSNVVYSNIKFGPIGSTFDSSSVSSDSGSSSGSAVSSSASQAVAGSSTAAAAAQTVSSATQSSAAASTTSVEAQAQYQTAASSASAATEAATKPKTCKRRNKAVQN